MGPLLSVYEINFINLGRLSTDDIKTRNELFRKRKVATYGNKKIKKTSNVKPERI